MQGLAEASFLRGGLFVDEDSRIFVSSMANNPHYRAICQFLGSVRYADRKTIAAALKAMEGGGLSRVLDDLVLSGLIYRYVPFSAQPSSKLLRFALSDFFLRFAHAFITPRRAEIDAGKFERAPLQALSPTTFAQWCGYSFEHYCQRQAHLLANILGFGAIEYRAGAYFNRRQAGQGYQLDLVFERADKVYTVCEIKYSRAPVDSSIIAEFEQKLTRFMPRKNYRIHRVLISAAGISESLKQRPYFDVVLGLEELLG